MEYRVVEVKVAEAGYLSITVEPVSEYELTPTPILRISGLGHVDREWVRATFTVGTVIETDDHHRVIYDGETSDVLYVHPVSALGDLKKWQAKKN